MTFQFKIALKSLIRLVGTDWDGYRSILKKNGRNHLAVILFGSFIG